MFFTREDILKIQNALLQLSVKDSELPNAEPVTYDDTLSIVQNGKNKQIKIEDFFNQISLWKREDFINITDKYDEHYISLIGAINLVPVLQRKDGLVITFQDIEGNWEIYQFRGNITEFFKEDKWFNLYDYRNNIIQSIVPDEEDLTASIPNENGNSLVSLKDRVYAPTSFSGKGYKILRKNIIDGKNVLTQNMINQPNTIYDIRYDFDLDRETIEMQEGCILKFKGGSLKNGKIFLNNTSICAPMHKIFTDISFVDNSSIINDFYTIWGLDTSGTQIVTDTFNNIIKLCSYSKVNLYVNEGLYCINKGLKFYDSTCIIGMCAVSTDDSKNYRTCKIKYVGEAYTLAKGNNSDFDIFSFYDYGSNKIATSVTIKNLYIEGEIKARYALNISHSFRGIFDNIMIRQFVGGCIYAHSSLAGGFTSYAALNNISNVYGWNSTDSNGRYHCRYGIRLQSQTNGNIFNNCRFVGCEYGVALEDCIDKDGETYIGGDWSSNQNLFNLILAESCACGYYINSEQNTFIACRAEGGNSNYDFSYPLYFPKLDNIRRRYNLIVGFAYYGTEYQELTNDYSELAKNNLLESKGENYFKKVITDSIVANKAIEIDCKKEPIAFNNFNFAQFTGSDSKKLNLVIRDSKVIFQIFDGENFIDAFSFGINPTDSIFNFAFPILVTNFSSKDEVPLNYTAGRLVRINNNLAYYKRYDTPLSIKTEEYNEYATYGTLSDKPTPKQNKFVGFTYFDTTNNRPIYWTGSKWVDATGSDIQ